MKKILILLTACSVLLIAADSATEKKTRLEKQLKLNMEQEEKFAREQTFYSGSLYDLKGSEVNQDSVDSIKELENQDDFDMDSVYD